jgi:hypothetical protein
MGARVAGAVATLFPADLQGAQGANAMPTSIAPMGRSYEN